jgi:hypothetical protein
MRGQATGGGRQETGRRARALGLAVLVLAALAPGCGYRLVGTSSNLPPKLKKLYIAPFINQTTRAELDQRMTEQVTQEWVRRGRFQLVSSPEQADAVLTGTIVAAMVIPVQFDMEGRATQYQLTVSADVQLIDRTGQKPVTLWRDPRFARSSPYNVNVNANNYFDQEIQAIDQLSLDFARALVVTILEGF